MGKDKTFSVVFLRRLPLGKWEKHCGSYDNGDAPTVPDGCTYSCQTSTDEETERIYEYTGAQGVLSGRCLDEG